MCDDEIKNYEIYLKQKPDVKSIKEVIKTLKDFDIRIKKSDIPHFDTNIEMFRWKKTFILNKLKTRGDL